MSSLDEEARNHLPPAARAFDKTAPRFDERFGSWRSVTAQRAAVRACLRDIFSPASRLLELGAGTGEDALYMLDQGYRVTITDGSPTMVRLAREKVLAAGYGPAAFEAEHLVIEELAKYAKRRTSDTDVFDGAYSNFAALNCVEDFESLGAPLARLIRPGGNCAFVLFGPCSIGEIVVEVIRRRPKAALRRLRKGPAPAKLGGEHFQVWYPSPREVARALAPYFRLRAVHGIGILVPPSAAEPWISGFPTLLSAFAAADRVVRRPLALLGDHVLIHLERTAHVVNEPVTR